MIAINNGASPSPDDGDDDGKDEKHRERKSRTRGRRKLGRGKKCADLTVDDVPLLKNAVAKGFQITHKVRRRMERLVGKLLKDDMPPDTQIAGAELGIRMEAINVAVDRNRIAETKSTDHKHVHLHGIEIKHVDDWYGSQAANLAAPDGSSATDPPRG